MAAKGLLRVTGELDITQFWPTAGSDADTVKVKVNANSFEFSSDPSQKPFTVTQAFKGAAVKGRTKKLAISSKNEITIRLQGIDAPELHYEALLPTPKELKDKGLKLKNNGTKFRQFFGETATTKLHDLISKSKEQIIKCEVTSAVDHPNEVFDTFGRFIGDINVTVGTKKVNINRRLVQDGWAFPTFYNSMSKDEITSIRQFANAAKKAKKGIWKHLASKIGQLNLGLIFRPPQDKPKSTAEAGPVLMPKIFRRQVKFTVSQINQLPNSAEFGKFLAAQSDGFVKTANFLKNPNIKPSKKNQNLSVLLSQNGSFGTDPGDLVFFENSSTLIGADNKPVTSWGIT
jgi:endonuclease YncB( thermonuclease family)